MKKVKHIYMPNIESADSIIMPDEYSLGDMSRPSKGFVVSRNRDGTVASRYGDFIWDMSAYNSRGRPSKLQFAFWEGKEPTSKQVKLCEDIQWLMFLLIWRRRGDSLSTGALLNYATLLRAVGRFADQHAIELPQLFGQSNLLGEFLIKQGVGNIKQFLSLYKLLVWLGEDEVGFPLLSRGDLNKWDERKRLLASEYQQTSPIPSRIYSSIISELIKELSKYTNVLEGCTKLSYRCIENPLLGMYRGNQREKAKRAGIDFTNCGPFPSYAEMLIQYGLDEFFESNNLPKSRTGMIGLFGHVHMICKALILIYSGMRKDEADDLPYDCLKEIKSGSRIQYRLTGTTTKLSNGHLRKTRWITSKEGAQAVRVAQKVADVIYHKLRINPQDRKEAPLFVSLNYLRRDRFDITHGIRAAVSRRMKEFNFYKQFMVTEQDLKELEQIDPYRAWRREPEYQVGAQWPLKNHQFRRSLALYASRSGLVSMPSLRRQLQHITEAMSRYYASGSASARNLIREDKKHFGWEYQSTQPQSQALAYMANVLLSDERLFGAHGSWFDKNIRNNNSEITLEHRDKTMKDFESGLVAYKETSLGGCTEVLACDKKALRSITGCLDCSRSVIKESNLTRVIGFQESLVQQLDPNSMEGRTEQSYLEDLKKYKEKMSV